MSLRLVFMGTPEFAATVLERVLRWDGGEVVAVYTQPDRPCGRGQVCKPSPVKELALARGLRVLQPVNFKADSDVDELKALAPDVLLVAAYGLILPQRVLDIPTHGAVNVHASLLPKYRGAAPIQRVILAGEHATGITIMKMEAGLDSGPMLLQRALRIADHDTAQSIHDELSAMGGDMLVDALELLRQGKLTAIPQDHSKATYAPKLEKKEGEIDWDQPAQDIHNRVRAMHPWPGAFFSWQRNDESVRLGIQPGRVGGPLPPEAKPGEFLGLRDGLLAIACRDRAYLVPTLQPQGKRAMPATAFACGYLGNCPDLASSCAEAGQPDQENARN
jgi:methionyl-tRNA formyltransferase